MDEDIKGSFDKLVAGLSTEDRNAMLERINKNSGKTVQLFETEVKPAEYNMSLTVRLERESIFYRFLLWLRGFINKKSTQIIYNEDIITGIARKVNREHPGLVDHKHSVLQSVFYDQLRRLKEAADFFKPYILLFDDDPGNFYVFLSSFVAPELADRINSEADPFILPFGQDPSIEIKSDLVKKLDEILKNIDGTTKTNLYAAITAVNWLKQFTKLPFIHFCSQFTDVADGTFTCPYSHAKTDFNYFAKVFSNIQSLDNEVLEALFLYSQRKDLTKNVQTKDIEKASNEFLAKANGFLGCIEMFIAGVPMYKIGKIVNGNYDWEPESPEGAEAWFPSFRSHWRKILDVRWNDWVRERKKHHLTANLYADFKLSEFPMMKNRPWAMMWMQAPFNCELTGGFLCWFALEKFDGMLQTLNEVMMEGVFIRSENRTEYSEGLDQFIKANNRMIALTGKLSADGEYGSVFKDFSESKIKTLQVQNQIDTMMRTTEVEIREITKEFGKGCRTMEAVFHGFFDEKKDGVHETLQNLTAIKGHQNREWRDNLMKIRETLKKAIFYISELEPIETVKND